MFKRNHFMLDLFDAFVAEYEEKTGVDFHQMTNSQVFTDECYKAFRGGATYDQAMHHMVTYTEAILP